MPKNDLTRLRYMLGAAKKTVIEDLSYLIAELEKTIASEKRDCSRSLS